MRDKQVEKALDKIVKLAPTAKKLALNKNCPIRVVHYTPSNSEIWWEGVCIFAVTTLGEGTWKPQWEVNCLLWEASQKNLKNIVGQDVVLNECFEILEGSFKGKIIRANRPSPHFQDFVETISGMVSKKILVRVNPLYIKAHELAKAVALISDWNQNVGHAKKISILNGKPVVFIGLGGSKTLDMQQTDIDIEEVAGKLVNKYIFN